MYLDFIKTDGIYNYSYKSTDNSYTILFTSGTYVELIDDNNISLSLAIIGGGGGGAVTSGSSNYNYVYGGAGGGQALITYSTNFIPKKFTNMRIGIGGSYDGIGGTTQITQDTTNTFVVYGGANGYITGDPDGPDVVSGSYSGPSSQPNFTVDSGSGGNGGNGGNPGTSTAPGNGYLTSKYNFLQDYSLGGGGGYVYSSDRRPAYGTGGGRNGKSLGGSSNMSGESTYGNAIGYGAGGGANYYYTDSAYANGSSGCIIFCLSRTTYVKTNYYINYNNLDLGNLFQKYLTVGTINIFSGKNLPEFWIWCDGSELLINDYKKLYDVIGTTYGGNGTTTFKIPDLRTKMPIGNQNMSNTNSSLSNISIQYNSTSSFSGGNKLIERDQLAQHTHNVFTTDTNGNKYISGTTFFTKVTSGETNKVQTGSNGVLQTPVTGSILIGNGDITSYSGQKDFLPPFTVLNYIIKFI